MDQSQSNSSAKDEKHKSEEPETAESSSTSHPKSVWNDKLCKKFLCVVGLLGVDNCSPVKLLQLLNVPGLTRDQAAGKLKLALSSFADVVSNLPNMHRYRKSLRKVKEDASSGKKTVNYPVLPRTKLPGRWSSLEKNGQAALKIGSASTRPSFVTEKIKDEPTAEVVKQPIWPSVNDQLPAIEKDRLREALWRTFPYRRPAAVEKVDPYPNYACMASNATSSNQNLRHVNGLLQQYSTNEALFGNILRSSTTTLMNRSSSCSSTGFHVPNINIIGTSLGKSTEAISLMGTSTSWGMNVATLGGFNSSYASGYYFRNTMEAPVGSSTRINTNTAQSTFQAQGPNYQEVITPDVMNNAVVMQAPGFTSTTQNFAAAYGNGREVTVPNYMNISMQEPVSIGLTSSTQTLTAYGGNGEVTRYMNTMGALGHTNPMQNTMDAALGSIGFSKTTENFPDYVNLDNPGILQMPRTNPNLFGYDQLQVKEQADHSPEDAHSVTGDHSPPRVLLDDPDQLEAPLTSPGRRGSNPDLFEMVYNQGREYGRQDSGEEMDGFQYLLNSSENIISETVMSGVQLQIPDAHLSGSWVEP